MLRQRPKGRLAAQLKLPLQPYLNSLSGGTRGCLSLLAVMPVGVRIASLGNFTTDLDSAASTDFKKKITKLGIWTSKVTWQS
jgi:hypothetical protein